MASPSSVLSMGYGSWGSVNLLPTLGFGLSTTTTGVRICGTAMVRPALLGTFTIGTSLRGAASVSPALLADLSLDCDCEVCQ